MNLLSPISKGYNFHLALLVLTVLCSITFAQKYPNETAKTRTSKTKVFVNPNGELTIKQITQNRKIAHYDYGGSIDCTRLWLKNFKFTFNTRPKGLCDENEARNFIWEHWVSKQRGYLRIRYSGIDTSNTEHIFIEPDKNGNWAIRWRSVNASAITRGGEVADFAKIVSVQRTENKPSSGEWALVFKNAEGTIIWSLPYFPL